MGEDSGKQVYFNGDTFLGTVAGKIQGALIGFICIAPIPEDDFSIISRTNLAVGQKNAD